MKGKLFALVTVLECGALTEEQVFGEVVSCEVMLRYP